MPALRPSLTREELNELTRQFLRLTPYELLECYQSALRLCEMNGDRIPDPAAVQRFVTVWKVMRKRAGQRGSKISFPH